MQRSAVESEDPAAQGVRSRVLSAHDLSKAYGRQLALRGLSFSLQRGRVLGLLGPNGAGKTTAIRILTTIIEPSSGHFFIDRCFVERIASAHVERCHFVPPRAGGTDGLQIERAFRLVQLPANTATHQQRCRAHKLRDVLKRRGSPSLAIHG